MGCKFAVQATVRTGKSLTVGFRPLPDWTPARAAPDSLHCYRKEPEALYRRITELTLEEDDGVALRWMITGLHQDEDFVGMHTMSRLTIEELAHLVRSAFGEKQTPYRSWLNQWAREPDRPLPGPNGPNVHIWTS